MPSPLTTPAATAYVSVKARPIGTASAKSLYLMFVLVEVEVTSTSGAWPLTVIVSVLPGSRVKSRFVFWFSPTVTSLRMTVVNPPGASARTV